MITEPHGIAAWLKPIAAMVAANGRRGPFFVAMPEYRPDLVAWMAADVSLAFVDFRAEVMREMGWQAAQLPLSRLTEYIAERASASGIVLHNAEALLAAKPTSERREWLHSFAATGWSHPVIVPIAIFQADLPAVGTRFHRVDPADLPAETLLSRLATQ